MRRVRIIGLCLAAAFAVSAAGASGAMAADLLARVAGGGSIAGATFLLTGTLPLVIAKSGRLFKCQKIVSRGLFTNSTLGSILMRYSGCAIDEVSFPMNCNTPGAGTGEIHLPSSTLFSVGLAHLGANGTIPALAILPGSKTELICDEAIKIEVKGDVIAALQLANGEQVPLNLPAGECDLNFQQTANGEQRLRLILLPGSSVPSTYDLETSFFGNSFELASELANTTLNAFTLSDGAAIDLELVAP